MMIHGQCGFSMGRSGVVIFIYSGFPVGGSLSTVASAVTGRILMDKSIATTMRATNFMAQATSGGYLKLLLKALLYI